MIKELQLTGRVAIVSDIHIAHDHDAELATMAAWLRHTDADVVILLGDIFAMWLGDAQQHALPQSMAILRQACQSRQVYWMHGNRDFLMSEALLQKLGMQALNDPCVVDNGKTRLLLTHGDRFCMHDVGYQRLRTWLRHPWTLTALAYMPWVWKQVVARRLRQASRTASQKKPAARMDVCLDTLAAYAAQWRCNRVVHGHVHVARVCWGGTAKQKIAIMGLGCWQSQPNTLIWYGNSYFLGSLPLPAVV